DPGDHRLCAANDGDRLVGQIDGASQLAVGFFQLADQLLLRSVARHGKSFWGRLLRAARSSTASASQRSGNTTTAWRSFSGHRLLASITAASGAWVRAVGFTWHPFELRMS